MPMDISSSAPDDVNNSRLLYIHPIKSSNEEFSIKELENNVTTFLNIQDNSKSPNGKHESQKKTEATEKYYSRCSTFPFSNRTKSSSAACVGAAVKGEMKDSARDISKESTPDDNVKPVDPPCLQSSSMPTAPNPVSAMKGSRENRGAAPPTKLTVKWAPDVYDPIPTTSSHTITNNKPQKPSKKTSKNKHKNTTKSSRGSKHKDKKQTRKRGGTSFKSPEEEVADDFEPPPTAMDFHVGNPDQFCGGSFLQRYARNLHISSVAEAT